MTQGKNKMESKEQEERKFYFIPKGVCCKSIEATIAKDGTLLDIDYYGGCEGNLKTIKKLIIGKNIHEISSLLSGITCGLKGTSCSDQLAKLLATIELE